MEACKNAAIAAYSCRGSQKLRACQPMLASLKIGIFMVSRRLVAETDNEQSGAFDPNEDWQTLLDVKRPGEAV
jgi:hypothetical protein